MAASRIKVVGVLGGFVLVVVLVIGVVSFLHGHRYVSNAEHRRQHVWRVQSTEYEKFLEANLPQYLETQYPGSFGGKLFCSYDRLGDEDKGQIIEAYLNAGCQEYYVKDGKLEQGTGGGGPGMALIRQTTGGYEFVLYNIPRSGSFYADDIDAMFPPKAKNRYRDLIKDQTEIWAKHEAIKHQAVEYFKVTE